jgi:catechol 2,3-dioxygenase-like lactoylglutathione lyase family enzyme
MSDNLIRATLHTGLTVSDLDRSIAFYRDVLGFGVSEKISLDGAHIEGMTGIQGAAIRIAHVQAPGHDIELLQYVKPEGRRLSDLRPCDTGASHIAFLVEDVDAVLEAIKAHGFEPMGPPQAPPSGRLKGGRVAYVRDPDNTTLEFQQLAKA